ncbi:transmembrane 4 L6 family member 5-like [Protopterus annectens]|uniref:transmembrane 4 L6 family member 5-like n=1 Tax=Protopterus annectens TaxID=7888 RepID=UPI001CF9454D|nr:transmembrane 4 L6 family member 5-like [Protopterus annectens]
MCTGKCAKCIGITLYPFVVLCIICNVILFFPNFDYEYITNPKQRMTVEVMMMGGLLGGGLLVLFPAIHIQATGREGCCNNRCGMFLSIIFAAIGIVGAAYCFVISTLGIVHGPTCLFLNGTDEAWGTPFKDNITNFNSENYLFDTNLWDKCEEPDNVVIFNIILFGILMGSSFIEFILCFVQMINGLFGCICGTCGKKKQKARAV